MTSPPPPHPHHPTLGSHPHPGIITLLEGVGARARAAGVFGPIGVHAGMLVCEAANSAEPADYRVLVDKDRLWVALTTPDRWLSQSMEADLMHTGDKIEDLIEEELVNIGWEGGAGPESARPSFEHFRDADKLYTFRTPVPVNLELAADPATEATVALWLLAYEACFRQLGDMDAGGEAE